MRLRIKSVCVGIFCVATIICTCVPRLVGFVHIFHKHSGITLTQRTALDAYNNNDANSRPQLIPRIIHQVFHNWGQPGNNTLPADWQEVRQTCIDLNPDFDVKLWTEELSWDFIAKEYPWFLNTYEGYHFKVQRVDAVRYFLMLHYGGIYMDLDNVCTSFPPPPPRRTPLPSPLAC